MADERMQRGCGLLMQIRRLWSDRRGVGAVEFALIAPLLLMIYITVFELTIGLSISKRVTRAAGTIADLVTQQQESVSDSFLNSMEHVAQSIFVPYGGTTTLIKITGIALDAAANPKVAWSWDESGGKPHTTGNTITIPDKMKVANTFIVHAEVSVPHQLLMFMPGLIPSEMRSITISRDYYYRSRSGKAIACTDC
ncbi:TadE/TadG family type IV pilus assembly protein [Pseudorhizobium marinum]|uniref:TadE/TadG family type IV pilus assembly protein n=1 Tax=Pseudorhizobium marinum TaxID=1496690 RepID=UPI00049519CA|nr:TadE/TadG family type IV pilus assembly protein [Pseudorhizobium marinum]|tara:strand:- start:1021 stop:1608 length:588 start_codon:yes stop_codon:yes gene_type:complete